jgi:hypothetical protein
VKERAACVRVRLSHTVNLLGRNRSARGGGGRFTKAHDVRPGRTENHGLRPDRVVYMLCEGEAGGAPRFARRTGGAARVPLIDFASRAAAECCYAICYYLLLLGLGISVLYVNHIRKERKF